VPAFNPRDVDLDGDVAGGQGGRPWREAPLLDSEARSQTDRGYGESGVAFLSRPYPWQDKQSMPGAVRYKGQHIPPA